MAATDARGRVRKGRKMSLKKVKERITPEINAQVDMTLNEWFGVEYETIKE